MEKHGENLFVTRIRAQIDERWNLFTVVVDPRTGNCAIKPEA